MSLDISFRVYRSREELLRGQVTTIPLPQNAKTLETLSVYFVESVSKVVDLYSNLPPFPSI